jgi:anti-anti-sigma factor
MNIAEIRVDNDITHIALVGRLDIAGVHAVDVRFHGYTAARRRPTLVDLSQLAFISSLGIGMLISCAKSLERHKVRFVLYGAQDLVEEVMKVVGLHQIVPLVKTQEEAMQALKGP